MNKNLGSLAWQSFWLGSLTLSGILIFNLDRAMAQVIPDNTLGEESSVVNPRDATSDSIDGGARRGQNLFHSFQEFNVDAGRGVYFLLIQEHFFITKLPVNQAILLIKQF